MNKRRMFRSSLKIFLVTAIFCQAAFFAEAKGKNVASVKTHFKKSGNNAKKDKLKNGKYVVKVCLAKDLDIKLPGPAIEIAKRVLCYNFIEDFKEKKGIDLTTYLVKDKLVPNKENLNSNDYFTFRLNMKKDDVKFYGLLCQVNEYIFNNVIGKNNDSRNNKEFMKVIGRVKEDLSKNFGTYLKGLAKKYGVKQIKGVTKGQVLKIINAVIEKGLSYTYSSDM